MSTNNQPATSRIPPKKQTLEDAYSPPANFLEIDITDPQTHGLPKSKGRYTDYAVKMKVLYISFILSLIRKFSVIIDQNCILTSIQLNSRLLTLEIQIVVLFETGNRLSGYPINLNFLFLCINV